jgi:hypothetical protein
MKKNNSLYRLSLDLFYWVLAIIGYSQHQRKQTIYHK